MGKTVLAIKTRGASAMKVPRQWRRQQMEFLELFTTLLENGFSIQESLAVIQRSQMFSSEMIQRFETTLTSGQSLADCFEQTGFSEKEVTQIQMAEIHGNLSETLESILKHRQMLQHQKSELQKLGTYPLLLLLFMMGLFSGMRRFLLPQLLDSQMVDATHWGITLLVKGPRYFFAFVFLLLISVLGSVFYLQKKSLIERAEIISRLPFTGFWYRLYQTSYFALEWGNLFCQGLELKQILTYLSEFKEESLMTELADELNEGLARGELLTSQLPEYDFLTTEFSLIIFQGEVKGKLGEELLLYSQLLMKKWVEKVEKTLQWLQPVVFLLVAFLILSIYLAMFLPIYTNIGGSYL